MKADDRRQMTDDGQQMTDDGQQMTDDGQQKIEIRNEEREKRSLPNAAVPKDSGFLRKGAFPEL